MSIIIGGVGSDSANGQVFQVICDSSGRHCKIVGGFGTGYGGISGSGGSQVTTHTNPPPTYAVLKINNVSLYPNREVYVDVYSQNVGNIQYDFGDGTVMTKNPYHKYSHTGNYRITVTAENYDNNLIYTYKDIVVADINAASSFIYITSGFQVDCKDTSNADTSTFGWDFGDGTGTFYGREVLHTYADYGNYTVTHQAGNASAIARVVTLSEIPPLVAGTGTGTINDPYMIGTLEQLAVIRNYSGWYYELANDIDATSTATDLVTYPSGWVPINYFDGSLKGNGFVIDGLYGKGSIDLLELGLFYTLEGATISDLGLTNVDMENSSWVGVLAVASHYSTISNCYTTGVIQIPELDSYGAAAGFIKGSDYDVITNCYCVITVYDYDEEYYAPFAYLYYSGVEDTVVTSCYYAYDSLIMGLGTNKTTAEMKQKATFVGWDFSGTWSITEGVDYPQLAQATVAEKLDLLVADFSANPNTGDAPITIQFSDTSTGNPTSWLWDFGDGTTSTLQNPQHTYTIAGLYSVQLLVTNAVTSQSTIQIITITESEILPNTPPIADFAANVLIGKAPLTVLFSDTSQGTIATYAWDFGDGATSTLANPQHTYTDAGTYTISLTVTDSNGLSSIATTIVEVIPADDILINSSILLVQTDISYSLNVAGTEFITAGDLSAQTDILFDVITNTVNTSDYPPTANIHADKMAGFAPMTVNFTADVSTPDVIYLWSFGDGTTSALATPGHTFSKSGTFTVTLTVSNVYGSTQSTMTVFVAGWMGKYILGIDNYNYYYIIDRAGDYVYIYNYGTSAFISKFGGYGDGSGKFNIPTTLTVVKPI